MVVDSTAVANVEGFVDNIEQHIRSYSEYLLLEPRHCKCFSFLVAENLMRPLKKHESEKLFSKLSKYIGNQTASVHENDGTRWVLRLHKKKIFYFPLAVEKYAAQIKKKNLIAIGACIAKMTHSGNIRINITALSLLSKHSSVKFWVKPNQEQAFLYGNNVTKNGLGRISDDTLQHQGCVVYSMGDIPLGFGVTAQSSAQCKRIESNAITLFHEADIGEFIRNEDAL